MKRIRSIKPELFDHEGLFDAELATQLPLRLAFISLWTCCDKAGRFKWRPRWLQRIVLPYDDVEIGAVLDALWQHGFLLSYTVEGVRIGCIPSWEKHQYINNRETESGLPAPEEGDILNASEAGWSEKGANERVQIEENKSKLTPIDASTGCETQVTTRAARVNGMENNLDDACSTRPVTRQQAGSDKKTNTTHASEGEREREGEQEREREKELFVAPEARPCKLLPTQVVFKHWQEKMQHPNAKLDGKREKLIRQALSWGYTVPQLLDAITGCAQTPHNIGQNDRNQRYDGLHVILRDGDQIDRFIRNCQSPPVLQTVVSAVTQHNVLAGQRWLARQSEVSQPVDSAESDLPDDVEQNSDNVRCLNGFSREVSHEQN